MIANWLERATNQQAAAATDVVLASGDANRQIVVHWVFFSTMSSGTAMLESGTATRLWEMYPDANGGAVLVGDPNMVLFECAVGEDLTYSFNVADNHFIAVGFTRRNV